MTESDQGEPEAAYGQTKRDAEIKLLELGHKTQMDISIVRPALVYGPGVKGNLKRFISAVVDGQLPTMVETENRRSMIHVEDLVSALLLVAKDKRACGEIYIATDGVDYTTRKLYDAIRAALGRRPSRLAVPKALFYFRALLGDITRGRFPFDSYDFQKLFDDECYSSEKLHGIGFEPRHTLYSAMSSIVAKDFCHDSNSHYIKRETG